MCSMTVLGLFAQQASQETAWWVIPAISAGAAVCHGSMTSRINSKYECLHRLVARSQWANLWCPPEPSRQLTSQRM